MEDKMRDGRKHGHTDCTNARGTCLQKYSPLNRPDRPKADDCEGQKAKENLSEKAHLRGRRRFRLRR